LTCDWIGRLLGLPDRKWGDVVFRLQPLQVKPGCSSPGLEKLDAAVVAGVKALLDDGDKAAGEGRGRRRPRLPDREPPVGTKGGGRPALTILRGIDAYAEVERNFSLGDRIQDKPPSASHGGHGSAMDLVRSSRRHGLSDDIG